MSFFEKVVAFLQVTNESPTNYGGFHLVSIGLCVLVTVLLCVFAKDVSNRTFRKIIGVMWLAIVILEIYKQIVFAFNAETVTIGLGAGVFGILTTLILEIPINLMLKYLTHTGAAAQLPVGAAIALVAISVTLTFVAGLIPSSIAAKKDPVEALRSE